MSGRQARARRGQRTRWKGRYAIALDGWGRWVPAHPPAPRRLRRSVHRMYRHHREGR